MSGNKRRRRIDHQLYGRRTRLKHWLRRAPRRAVCLALGHTWGKTGAVITSGPLHVSPEERDYQVLGFTHQCSRCWHVEEVPGEPGAEQDEIASARAEDLAEWDDPLARAEHLELVEEVEDAAREWLDRDDP